jgi:Pvc16 N-terminal domain
VSTALAVAAVTRVLSSVIDQAIQNAGANAILGTPPYLTTKSPDQLEVGTGEAAQLSLFLYHVTTNQGWSEVGLPTRNSAGAPVDRPPLALDLHYLLIAYGDSEYIPQVLLGLGMQALHETPFLYRQQITSVFTPPPPLVPLDAALATAGLDGQVEMVKITPEPLSTEDLSKLWTAFGGKFRPSAGYAATVVLIESNTPVQPGLPVQTANVTTLQLRQPNITGVTPTFVPWATALSLTLVGTNLTGPGVMVVFDNNPTAPQTPTSIGPPIRTPIGLAGITVTVPVPLLPAGINTLRVVQQVAVGAPPPKNVVESNVSLFYLQPVIRQGTTPPNDDLITAGAVDNTVTPPVTPVTVQLDPALQISQQVQLLLNELDPPAGDAPLSFTFDATAAQIGTNTVTFSTFGTRSGPYLVRVRVDGAESLLRTDPGTGAFAHPVVTL